MSDHLTPHDRDPRDDEPREPDATDPGVRDLEVRARDAGRALRTVAADRVVPLPLPNVGAPRRVRVAVAVLAVATVAVAVVLGPTVRVPTVDEAPVAGPGDVDAPVAVDGTLPVPPVGEAEPAYLADGTPVFVSHPRDGEVVVVGAVDGHDPGAAAKLVGFCTTSRWFEEPRHASRFNGWGDYTGGPSPHGLDDHEVEVLDGGDRVRLTGEVTTQRPRDDQRAAQNQQGPNCVEGPQSPELRIHRPPADPPTVAGSDVPSDRWVWARVTVGGTDAAPLLCDTDGSCPDDAPRVDRRAPLFGGDRTIVPATYTALVRRVDGRVRLLAPADPEAALPVGVPDLLPVPRPGGALPTSLEDGRPVFVTRTAAGEVHVLDASSTHFETDLIAACPPRGTTAGGLFDWAHASWDLSGGYHSGPGAGDLRVHPSELVPVGGGAEAVRVVGALGPPRDRGSDGPSERATAPCEAGRLVRHEPPEHRWSLDELPRDADGWFWVDARTVEVDGAPVLCAASGCDAASPPILTEPVHVIHEPRPVLVGLQRGRAAVEVREPVPADGESNPSGRPRSPSG